MNNKLPALELYKCVALTVIAIALLAIYIKMPIPFTVRNIQDQKVEIRDIPLVRVQGGNVNVTE